MPTSALACTAYGAHVKEVPPSRSVWCGGDEHVRCSHVAGVERISLWRYRRHPMLTMLLCDCGCHAECPLSGQQTAPRNVWLQRCACPGTVPVRQRHEQMEQRKVEMSAVMAQAREEGALPPAEIERRLRAVFEAHGERPPPLEGVSRLSVVATAPRGTRMMRLLWMGVLAVVRAVRWAWEPTPQGTGHDNRRQARGGFLVIAGGGSAAGVLTALAIRSHGWRRGLLGAIAAVVGLVSTWALVLLTGVTAVSRAAEKHGSDRPGPFPWDEPAE
jgi:hypothetical protein